MITTTVHTSPTSQPAPELASSWVRLWNGAYDLADSTIAPAFRLHAAMLAEAPTRTSATPRRWWIGSRSPGLR